MNNAVLFYTYIWRDAANVPFYVGKGFGDRSKIVSGRSAEFLTVHALGGCSVEIVDQFILESQAHAHEVELIEKYGRRDAGGVLVNKTDGGEGQVGWVPSAETRAKISAANTGRRLTPEHRAKLSVVRTGETRSPEACARISAAKIGWVPSAETRARMSAAHIGKSPGKEALARLHASNRLLPPEPGRFKGVSFHKKPGRWRANITLGGKSRHLGYFATPEIAAEAYDAAALTAFGDDCYLNFKDRVAVDGNVGLASAP